MTDFRSQHRHVLTNGVVVERLPLGFAAGRWWATFVYAAPDPNGGQPVDLRHIGRSVWVSDPDGLLEFASGAGGGGEREHEYVSELVDQGASQARVSYLEGGEEVGSELLALDPADRTGCFAVRLTDGSLVERLPVGRAGGMWRLRYVRSGVPRAEQAAEMDDLDGVQMPDKRFVRIRSTGPVERTSAACTFGGAIQPFGVGVPDTLTHLEIDYLFEDEVVGTEVLPLPDRNV